MSVQRKYLELFVEEATEILSKLNQRIVSLESGRAEPGTVDSALRLAHTLKGGARMVGLEPISTAAHEIEASLKAGADGAQAGDILAILDDIQAQIGRLVEAEPASLAVPPPPAADGEELADDLDAPAAAGAPAEGGGRVRVSVDRLDRLQNLVDDLVLQKARILGRTRRFQRAFRGLEKIAWEADGRDFTAAESERLQRVLKMISGRGMSAYLEELYRLDQMVGEIQENVLDARLVPLAELFDGCHRLVRDLSRELGKQIELHVEGAVTELDKRLLEAIQAPLNHLVRNAVDHGVEAPTERRQAGKPEAARITLRAFHRGSSVVVEVEDDGRGLSPDRIRSRAVRSGRLGASEAETATPEQLYYLLCQPGFTTRDQATQVSGRGIGLDVVKSAVEKFSGSLAIRSEPGRFSRFRLYLPLSVSSLSVLLVRAGGVPVAIPSTFVERCLKVAGDELAAAANGLSIEGRVLPVVSLARVFGVDAGPCRGRQAVVVLQFRGRLMALQVDSLEEEREAVLKPLGGHVRKARHVLGVSFAADGEAIPVLNVIDLHADWDTMVSRCRYTTGAASRRPRILVVDDSVTTRHMEQNILEGLGYRVVQAADGSEAWRHLAREVFDLVVTDVEMPQMDGLELTRRMRATPRTAAVPVVAVSHRVAPEDIQRGERAGVSAYLRKDQFSQRALGDMIRQLLADAPAQGRESGSPGDAGVIRVLVADDSRLVRTVLREILSQDDEIGVVAEAEDGAQAVEACLRERPDVIIMDVQMPVMDGLQAVEKIMAECPTPVIILSATVHPGEVKSAFRAVRAGAFEALPKPQGVTSREAYARVAEDLLSRLKLYAKVGRQRGWQEPDRPQSPPPLGALPAFSPRVVGIGASTGGPRAVQALLAALPSRFPCPILLVQHISLGFVRGFAEWLQREVALQIRVLEGAERLSRGTVYIAPAGRHLAVRRGMAVVRDDPPVNACRPSVDILLQSLAQEYGGHAVGVVLTGMGKDGAKGALAVKQAGGEVLVQDATTSVVFGMPRAAIEMGAATRVVPAHKIPSELVAAISGTPATAGPDEDR